MLIDIEVRKPINLIGSDNPTTEGFLYRMSVDTDVIMKRVIERINDFKCAHYNTIDIVLVDCVEYVALAHMKINYILGFEFYPEFNGMVVKQPSKFLHHYLDKQMDYLP